MRPTLWVVGCGAMAGAMLSRWRATGMPGDGITVVDPALPHVDGVRTVATYPDLPPPDHVLLGVKPQALAAVSAGLAAVIDRDTQILSILAGTTRATLQRALAPARIVRVMPNLPVASGEGAVVLHAPDCDRGPLNTLMAPLGVVEWLDDEALFDAVTALSGSGPAFVYRFTQALADGGVAMGLSAALADRLARATVAGAASLAKRSPEPLADLADRVASRGGSTRVGLDVLDADAALAKLIETTMRAARARNRALAEES